MEDDRVMFLSDEAWNAFLNNEWINFDDLTMQNSLFQSHTITASGGNDKTTARFSAGYYGNKNAYKKGKSERFTLRSNIDHKLADWMMAGVVTQVTHNVQHISSYQGLSSGGANREGTGIELVKAYGDHSFGLTVLTSWIKSIEEDLSGSGENQIVASQRWWNLKGNAKSNKEKKYFMILLGRCQKDQRKK